MSGLRGLVRGWPSDARSLACAGWLAVSSLVLGTIGWSTDARAAEPPATAQNAPPKAPQPAQDAKTGWPLVWHDDFERGAERWVPVDPEGWRIEQSDDGNHFYHQHVKASSYAPRHRSPLHQAYVKDVTLGSFVLEARVRSTHEDYGHRDACIFFGRENPSRLYYVHFGKQTDDHANQIFIVQDAPRAKISTQTTPGTPWDDAWHRVRVERDVKSGAIDVFFDDLERPAMRAVDKTIERGAIGLGSFDDTSAWDDLRIYAPASP